MRFSPGCACCETVTPDELCPGCLDGTRPYQIEVVIDGIDNDNCSVCSDVADFVLTDLSSLPSTFCYWFDPDLPGCKWINNDSQWRRGNYVVPFLNLFTATNTVRLEIQMYDYEHTTWDGFSDSPTVWIYRWEATFVELPIDCETTFDSLTLTFAGVTEYNGGSGSTQPCDATGSTATLYVV